MANGSSEVKAALFTVTGFYFKLDSGEWSRDYDIDGRFSIPGK
jgi:hypothetical protein